jgi:hypothetical protein
VLHTFWYLQVEMHIDSPIICMSTGATAYNMDALNCYGMRHSILGEQIVVEPAYTYLLLASDQAASGAATLLSETLADFLMFNLGESELTRAEYCAPFNFEGPNVQD